LLLAALDSLQEDMEQLQRAYEISFEGEGERSLRKVYLSERVEHDLDALEIAEELMASIGT
jgi:hypothetical protein